WGSLLGNLIKEFTEGAYSASATPVDEDPESLPFGTMGEVIDKASALSVDDDTVELVRRFTQGVSTPATYPPPPSPSSTPPPSPQPPFLSPPSPTLSPPTPSSIPPPSPWPPSLSPPSPTLSPPSPSPLSPPPSPRPPSISPPPSPAPLPSPPPSPSPPTPPPPPNVPLGTKLMTTDFTLCFPAASANITVLDGTEVSKLSDYIQKMKTTLSKAYYLPTSNFIVRNVYVTFSDGAKTQIESSFARRRATAITEIVEDPRQPQLPEPHRRLAEELQLLFPGTLD
ncbi:hypothetical protein Agub_g7074, partial [Astrephomene gubernaculifera]